MKYDAGRHFLSNQMIIGDDVVMSVTFLESDIIFTTAYNMFHTSYDIIHKSTLDLNSLNTYVERKKEVKYCGLKQKCVPQWVSAKTYEKHFFNHLANPLVYD